MVDIYKCIIKSRIDSSVYCVVYIMFLLRASRVALQVSVFV